MRVLLVHNYYRSENPSGEDIVFEQERDLLRERGHDVQVLEAFNDDLPASLGLRGTLSVSLNTVWSRAAAKRMARQLRQFEPNLVHVHNTFPQLSLSVLRACRQAGVPVVQTLHNFRPVCAAGTLFRDGRPCEDCIRRPLLPALQHGCYRGSRLATLPLVLSQVTARWARTWTTDVTACIAPSRFVRDTLARASFPAERVFVRPHWTPRYERLPLPGNGIAYLGRIDEFKGVGVLLRAAELAPDVHFHVIGSGPFPTAGAGANVTLHGRLTFDEGLRVAARCRAVVTPSILYESFGRTVIEAYSVGRPVIASRLGALAELVEEDRTGLLVPPGDSAALAAACARIVADDALVRRLAQGADEVFGRCYTPEVGYRSLLDIYEAVVGESGSRWGRDSAQRVPVGRP